MSTGVATGSNFQLGQRIKLLSILERDCPLPSQVESKPLPQSRSKMFRSFFIMAGFESPNYTQTPNDLFDELMRDMGEAELRIILAVIRNTFGWHRDKFQMSIRGMSRTTGLTIKSVQIGAEQLEKRGLIERVNDGQKSTYWQVKINKGVLPSNTQNDTSVLLSSTPVLPSNTQLGLNKDIKDIKYNDAEASENFFNPATPEGNARIQTVKAMNNGLNRRNDICDAVRIHLGISITKNNKANRELINFLMEVPEDQTIARFALFWKSIWPGNQGQPPTVNKIYELWPSAFPNGADRETRVMEQFEARLLGK